ncbi:MAG: hypothetical protein RLZZ546_3304 [Bacteroidota bacterium]
MKLIQAYFFAAFLFTGSLCLAQTLSSTNVNKPAPTLEAKDLAYHMGVIFADEMKKNGLSEKDKTLVLKGIEDYFNNKNTHDINTLTAMLKNLKASINQTKGKEFLEMNAKRKEIVTLASGLQYELISKSSNQVVQNPKLSDNVKTHYHGTLINGNIFDSSVNRGVPSTFLLNKVIKGWQEGIQLMNIGDKYKFYIPYQLGYGEKGSSSGSIPPYSTIIFEVELLEINPQ